MFLISFDWACLRTKNGSEKDGIWDKMGWDGSLRGVVWRKKVCIGLIKGLGNRVWPKTPKNLVFKDIFDFWDYWQKMLLSPGVLFAFMGP